ncbi:MULTISPECIES: hypothetical protein [Reichenbachiella]|uniref:Lipocalin-like domain-containing protein n=1 Tax=Reichenbachiella agariperforans TaxID=156994 RepID=A0A1M6THJ2_REIAG|nr:MULTISPECIES: hypothetical protein [Reichenbachiella]MBU2915442.1 hypothetical protein [Reichenbachiella agariperforans]SHK56465.1 hypothetical protein SAMN04488028_10647 [Reichenbachiella agariperforans]
MTANFNQSAIATFVLFFVLVLSSCESGKEKKQSLVGNWDVQWVTYPDNEAPMDPSINLTMNGKMDIKPDGKITISAFGYENCIFGKDTLVHSLEWEMLGDTLNVKNKGDEFGMPYKILEASDSKVKLQLVEDVYLFLTK